MFYLLLLLFSAAGYFIISKLPFVRRTGIPQGQLVVFYFIRIISALIIGWISFNFYPGGNDYWGLNEQGINEHHFLINDPAGFFKDLFHTNYGNYSGLFGAVGTYWNDLKNILLGKFLGFCNFLSRGNYYLNAVMWSNIGFLGSMCFYRGFLAIQPASKKAAKVAAFLIPSTIYFSSGIHKDLIIFSLLGLFFYCMVRIGKGNEKRKHYLYLLFCVVFIFLIRNYLAVILLPLATLYIISKRKKWNPAWVFGSGVMIALISLVLLQQAGPKFSVLRIIAERQEDFAELPPGGSDIHKPALKANAVVFIQHLPVALKDGFLRPVIWKSPLSLIGFSFEWTMIWFLVLLALLKWRTGNPDPGLVLFAILLCCSLFIITGYVVNNLGAIVRYRSIYLPFLVFPLLVKFQKSFNILK